MKYTFRIYTDQTGDLFFTRSVKAKNLEQAEESIKAIIDIYRVSVQSEDSLLLVHNIAPTLFKRVDKFPYVAFDYINNDVQAGIYTIRLCKGEKSGLIDVPEGTYMYTQI